MVAYTFCIIMSLLVIQRKTKFKVLHLLRRLVSIIVFTGIMTIVVVGVKQILNTFINYNDQYVLSYVYVAVAGFIGVIVYFALAVYFDLITALFGVNLSFKQLKKRILRRR